MSRFTPKNPRFLIVLGMFFIAAANLARGHLHPTAHLSVDAIDGALGFLYGVAIGIMILGVWRLSRKVKSCE